MQVTSASPGLSTCYFAQFHAGTIQIATAVLRYSGLNLPGCISNGFSSLFPLAVLLDEQPILRNGCRAVRQPPEKQQHERMERVGHHLQLHAVALGEGDERDLFGRSAYNRYYYAVFLRTRKMMRNLDATWSSLPHADYPEVLRGKIKKTLLKGKQKANKIGDAETIGIFSRAMTAAAQIADLMESASRVRVTADYNPQIPVEFLPGGRFTLNNVDVSVAHQWVEKTGAWADAIEMAWKQIDV